MSRRGWSTTDVPTGWVQVLRGPRPPSEKWSTVQKAVGRWCREKPSKTISPWQRSPPEYKPSRAPEVAFAIEVLGGDNVHTKSLQAALRSARTKTRVLPMSERVDACKMFMERAKKRVQRVQEVVDKALSQKAVHEAEVRRGTPVGTSPSRGCSAPASCNFHGDAVAATDRCPGARSRRIAGQSRQGMASGPAMDPLPQGTSPSMPTDRQELEGWLSDRNCDLRSAMTSETPTGGTYRWFGRSRSDPVGVAGSRPRRAHGRQS